MRKVHRYMNGCKNHAYCQQNGSNIETTNMPAQVTCAKCPSGDCA